MLPHRRLQRRNLLAQALLDRSDRLQLLRTHIALLVDLSNVLSRPDVRSLASMRDVSRLLGPVQRMKAALDTGMHLRHIFAHGEDVCCANLC